MALKIECCKECMRRHDPNRPHCPVCGKAMVSQDRDCIWGWGCGNRYTSGCYFWMPRDPRRSSDGGLNERNFCSDCDEFTPHHFWIYVENNKRLGNWFCVNCFGPLPSERENVQNSRQLTPSHPIHL